VKFRQLTYYFWVACSTVWSVHTPIDLENPLMKNVQEDTLHQKMTQGPVLELACVPDLLHPGVHWNGGDQYVKRLALLGNDRVRDPKITQPRPPTSVKWLSENRLKCDWLTVTWYGHSVQCWAQNWSSPTLEVATLGPRTGAHPALLRLLSSATRSSLRTILLLQPVFFLRSASRPDPSYSMEPSGDTRDTTVRR